MLAQAGMHAGPCEFDGGVAPFHRGLSDESMAEGDVYCTNNPWKGTGHLNDLVVTTPAFHHGRLIGLFSCTSHIVDLGGIGFGPDGTDVFSRLHRMKFRRAGADGWPGQGRLSRSNRPAPRGQGLQATPW